MSYILDALKKSEQQRGNGKIPDVQTVHSSSLNYRDEKKAYWPYFLIIAILLNLIAILYFIFDKELEPGTITPQEEYTASKAETGSTQEKVAATDFASPEEISVPETSSKKQAASNTEILSTPTKEEPVETKAEEKEISQPVKTAEDSPRENIIEYHDLPESLNRQIPTINISAHVYSSNPLQRSIVINNNLLEEGDYVLDDLILQEITVDGAIFDFDGTRFHYGVVSGWQ